MDIHADQDTTIPANVSISDDYFRYNTVQENLSHWARYNKCNGTGIGHHYPTNYDGGYLNIWCFQKHKSCANGAEVVWCAY